MTKTEETANAYLTMIPATFDDWLAGQATANPDSDWSLIRSAHLAGNLTEKWAREHASPEVQAEM